MTEDQIEIQSLQTKIKSLEAALSSEHDSQSQIEQLHRQLKAANESNDRLVASMEEMERQHA